MRTLKREEVDGRGYRDLAAAQASIGRLLEEVYNCQRLQSALAYLTPEDCEASQPPRCGRVRCAAVDPEAQTRNSLLASGAPSAWRPAPAVDDHLRHRPSAGGAVSRCIRVFCMHLLLFA